MHIIIFLKVPTFFITVVHERYKKDKKYKQKESKISEGSTLIEEDVRKVGKDKADDKDGFEDIAITPEGNLFNPLPGFAK